MRRSLMTSNRMRTEANELDSLNYEHIRGECLVHWNVHPQRTFSARARNWLAISSIPSHRSGTESSSVTSDQCSVLSCVNPVIKCQVHNCPDLSRYSRMMSGCHMSVTVSEYGAVVR